MNTIYWTNICMKCEKYVIGYPIFVNDTEVRVVKSEQEVINMIKSGEYTPVNFNVIKSKKGNEVIDFVKSGVLADSISNKLLKAKLMGVNLNYYLSRSVYGIEASDIDESWVHDNDIIIPDYVNSINFKRNGDQFNSIIKKDKYNLILGKNVYIIKSMYSNGFYGSKALKSIKFNNKLLYICNLINTDEPIIFPSNLLYIDHYDRFNKRIKLNDNLIYMTIVDATSMVDDNGKLKIPSKIRFIKDKYICNISDVKEIEMPLKMIKLYEYNKCQLSDYNIRKVIDKDNGILHIYIDGEINP